MKKLLALLLLCMLTPMCALADAVTYRYELQIGREAYRTLLTEAAELNPGDSADQREIIDMVTEMICGVLDVASVAYTVQDNGVEFAVLLQDERLVSIAVTLEGSELLISTSLLKDTVFVLDLSDAAETIAAVDWDTLGSAISDTAYEWLLKRDITYDATGSFAGSAYEGGNERFLVHMDDADIALLVEGLLLTAENSDMMNTLHQLFGMEAVADVIREIRKYNYEAALDNAYEYEVAVVNRTEGYGGELIGVSLNVLREGETVWSLSCGGENENFRVIAAFHVDGMTNYFALTQDVEAVSGREETTTVTFAIYQAAQGVTYAEASADPSSALLYNQSVMTSVTAGTSTHYRRTATGEEKSIAAGEETMSMRIEMTEDYAASPFTQTIESKLYMDEAAEPFATYRLEATSIEEFTHPENARRISVSELMISPTLRNEVEQEIMETGVNEMAVIAFQHLPAELLMLLLELAQ